MLSPTRATTRLILEKGQPAAHTGRRLRTAAAAAAGKIEARRGEERERKEAVELMRRERGERTHTHAREEGFRNSSPLSRLIRSRLMNARESSGYTRRTFAAPQPPPPSFSFSFAYTYKYTHTRATYIGGRSRGGDRYCLD